VDEKTLSSGCFYEAVTTRNEILQNYSLLSHNISLSVFNYRKPLARMALFLSSSFLSLSSRRISSCSRCNDAAIRAKNLQAASVSRMSLLAGTFNCSKPC
jgi:hypothetical protein